MTDGIRLSVLLPTRGRPEKLNVAVRSLLQGGRMPYETELLIGANTEDDDPGPLEELSGIPGVTVIREPAPLTLGRKVNRLAAKSHGDLLMTFANDMTFAEGWADRILDAVSRHTDPTVFYAKDPVNRDFTTIPIVRREMVQQVGFLAAPWFPFWFTDTWWDEIGTMVQSCIGIDVGLEYQGDRGKTQGLRDLAFWATFFEKTRPMRIGAAQEIAGGPPARETVELCARKAAHLSTPQFVRTWEAQAEPIDDPRYDDARSDAEAFLAQIEPKRDIRVGVCVPSTSTWQARMAGCLGGLTAFSSLSNIAVGILAQEGSMISKQRNDLVEIALSKDVDVDYLLFVDSDMIFPPDALVRLLKHGKDIVGATYNKRVPPYETLGRLVGDVPTDEALSQGGLWEAEFLPGGMMLIKAEVFRKLPWPWFWESYKFPGATGVEALKSFLRQNFATVPPDSVLAGIDGSKLGDWMNANWKIEGAGVWRYMSEDINFCRAARKNGYKIWCDLTLTGEMRHIGLQEVRCEMPAAKRMAAE